MLREGVITTHLTLVTFGPKRPAVIAVPETNLEKLPLQLTSLSITLINFISGPLNQRRALMRRTFDVTTDRCGLLSDSVCSIVRMIVLVCEDPKAFAPMLNPGLLQIRDQLDFFWV